ncbi:MAG TPA: YfiR family protein [Terriglobales bacterium]|nr:YfiR family protein [Terriglobales bacterium]
MAILSHRAAAGARARRLWLVRSTAGHSCARRAGRARGHTGLWIQLLALALLCPLSAAGQADAPGEYEVKAAFLYNFAKFVDWPAGSFSSPDAPLRLCVLGSDPALQALKQVVEGKKVNGRQMQVEGLRNLQQGKGCNVLFIGMAEQEETIKALREGVAPGLLTVGESEGFAQSGGVINLVLRQNHVAFEINVAAANRAGLRISSRLLSLAILVHDEPGGARN